MEHVLVEIYLLVGLSPQSMVNIQLGLISNGCFMYNLYLTEKYLGGNQVQKIKVYYTVW